MPYSLNNPPPTPRKEKRPTDLVKLWYNTYHNLLPDFEADERRRRQLDEAEVQLLRRRWWKKKERFLWLDPQFKMKPLDGPHRQPDGEILFL